MPPILSRSVLGRLAAHARTADLIANVNTAFASGNWTGFSGTGTCTPNVNAFGELTLTVSAGSGGRGAYYNVLELPLDHFVLGQRRFQTTGGAPGVIGRAKAASAPLDRIQASIPCGFSGQFGLYEIIGGSVVQSVLTNANRTNSSESSHALWCRGSLATTRQLSASGSSGPGDLTQDLAGLDAGTDGLRGGLYSGSGSGNTFTYRAFAAMRSALLRVEGPNSGTWQVRIRNAAGTLIYTSASHTAGVVEINTLSELTVLYAVGVPLMAQIEIYDPVGASVLVGPEVPSERLWGGDVWEWIDIPATPTGLAVTNPAETSLDVTWNASTGAVTYEAERSLDGITGWTQVYDDIFESFVDNGLTSSTEYFYRVRACNSAGCSDWSSVESGTTLSAGAPPVPNDLAVFDPTAFTLFIDWETSLNADFYELERSLDGATDWSSVYIGDTPQFTDVGLSPLTEYFYRVRACNGFGCSDWSANASGTTLAPPPPPGFGRSYRLRVRNQSTIANPNGTADALVVTSIRGGDNPYIAAPPEGDGQEIDLLTGQTRSGTYGVKVVDAPTGDDYTYGPGYSYGLVRYVTYKLEDAEFRQQLLSRRAYIEVSSDFGDSWEVLQAGYVTSIKLIDAISYGFYIGDTRRVETSRMSFTWSPIAGPTGVSERDVFPQRGCLIGGPILGGFGPVPDTGGDEVVQPFIPYYDDDTGRALIYVESRAGFLPPEYTRTTNTNQLADYYGKVLDPYAVAFSRALNIPTIPATYQAFFDESRGEFPALVVKMSDGTTTWTGELIGFNTYGISGRAGFMLLLDDASSVTPPTESAALRRIRIFKSEVGEDAPIYIDMHPIDIVTALFDTVGIQWDATTAEVVRQALGEDIRYALRITEPIRMLEFLTKSVFGPFGFSIRNNEVGAQEFYTTRLLSATPPSATINTNSLTTDEPPIFTLDESQIVSAFKVSYKTFAKTTQQPNASPPPPPDGVVENEVPIVIQNADLSVFATREIEYAFEGFVHLAGGWSSAMGQIISSIATLGFDRYGRGAPYMEASILSEDSAYSAKLGDEVYLDVAHYPNRRYRIGESDVGARIAQIVRRTITPYGALLKLVDSGLALQPVSPIPVISIALNPGAMRTVAQYTITNAAGINATNALFVAIEWAVGSSEPTGNGQVISRYEPGQVPTIAVNLPAVRPGSRVWVRARSEQTGRRPSAWTAWENVQLNAFAPPTGVGISSITAESFTVAWTPGNAAFWTEIFVAPGSIAPSDWAPFRVARLLPGSNRSVLRNLSAATEYIVGVCHVDPNTGEQTAFATDSDTTASNALQSPTPIALTVIQTEEDAGQPVGIGLGLWAFDESYDLEIQRANDNSGIPGVFSTIVVVPGTTQVFRDLLPSDGLIRWYRARHTLPGFNPSEWTGGQSGTPGACPLDLSRPVLQPVINAFAVDLGGGDYNIFYSGVGTIEYRVDAGSWSSPAPSPIPFTAGPYGNTIEFRSELNGITVSTTIVLEPNPGPIPIISTFSCVTSSNPFCPAANPWEIDVSWNCSPNNDVEYKLVLRNFDTAAQVGADFDTINEPGYTDVTSVTGDIGDTGNFHTRRYTLQVVRISDDAVIQELDSNRLDIETGPAC